VFEETVHDLCPPEAADVLVERAKRIAESLELNVAGARGIVLAKGEGFRRVPCDEAR
jgi:hemoglobin